MATTHRFGPFGLDADTGMLFCGSDPIALGQRAVALLRVLLERTSNIALDSEHRPEWVDSLLIRRYEQLPVRLVAADR